MTALLSLHSCLSGFDFDLEFVPCGFRCNLVLVSIFAFLFGYQDLQVSLEFLDLGVELAFGLFDDAVAEPGFGFLLDAVHVSFHETLPLCGKIDFFFGEVLDVLELGADVLDRGLEARFHIGVVHVLENGKSLGVCQRLSKAFRGYTHASESTQVHIGVCGSRDAVSHCLLVPAGRHSGLLVPDPCLVSVNFFFAQDEILAVVVGAEGLKN